LGLCFFASSRAAPLARRRALKFVVSAFGGVALTENNDLRLQQGGGTDLTFHNVSYKGKDFQSPPYYSARLMCFRLPHHPGNLGQDAHRTGRLQACPSAPEKALGWSGVSPLPRAAEPN